MLLHHPGELLGRCQQASPELLYTAGEELPGAGLRAIGPVIPEALLEEVGPEEPSVGPEELRQCFPGLPPETGQAGEQEELLPAEQLLRARPGSIELLLPHGVEGLQQVPDHVELVVEDHHPGAVGLVAPAEDLPHVHHDMGDLLLGSLLPKRPPELLQVLLLPPLAHKQELSPPRPILGMHQVPVALPRPTTISSMPRVVIPSRGRAAWPAWMARLSSVLTVPG